MSTTADAVVVGAGVIGASVALELSKAGLDVVVVDKAGAPGLGSTSASSAIVRFNYSTLDGVAASWESKHCWERWEEHLGHRDDAGLARLMRTGMVVIDAPVVPRGRVVTLLSQVGVPYEEWDAATLAVRVPGIDTGRYWPPKRLDDDAFFAQASGELGALYMPEAGYVDDPQLAAHNLAEAGERRGVRYRFRCTVTEVAKRNGRVGGVGLAGGEKISSPVVVNAAGPWSSALNRLADVGADFTIRVRPLRQEVHRVPAPASYSHVPERLGPSIADADLGFYLRPDTSGGMLVGGTEPACDPLEWIEDPDQSNPMPTADRFEAQVTRAARRLTTLTVPTAPLGISGVYDVADDWTPIYDRSDLEGFYLAIGTSGNQFKNAPVAGRLLARLVVEVEGGHDHDASPLQYHCEHTGRDIDLGSFSRRRRFNADTSGTVMG